MHVTHVHNVAARPHAVASASEWNLLCVGMSTDTNRAVETALTNYLYKV